MTADSGWPRVFSGGRGTGSGFNSHRCHPWALGQALRGASPRNVSLASTGSLPGAYSRHFTGEEGGAERASKLPGATQLVHGGARV